MQNFRDEPVISIQKQDRDETRKKTIPYYKAMDKTRVVKHARRLYPTRNNGEKKDKRQPYTLSYLLGSLLVFLFRHLSIV